MCLFKFHWNSSLTYRCDVVKIKILPEIHSFILLEFLLRFLNMIFIILLGNLWGFLERCFLRFLLWFFLFMHIYEILLPHLVKFLLSLELFNIYLLEFVQIFFGIPLVNLIRLHLVISWNSMNSFHLDLCCYFLPLEILLEVLLVFFFEISLQKFLLESIQMLLQNFSKRISCYFMQSYGQKPIFLKEFTLIGFTQKILLKYFQKFLPNFVELIFGFPEKSKEKIFSKIPPKNLSEIILGVSGLL